MKLRHFLGLTLLFPVISLTLTGCQGMGGSGHAVASVGPVYPGIGSYIVVEGSEGRVILASQPDLRRPVASLTKIATASVVLEFINKTNASTDEMMTVPPSAAALGSSPIGLQPGDGLSVRDGLYCAMMASDNLAAETLASHFGAKLSAAGLGGAPLQAFVNQMNGLASRLGMRNTRFANAHGLDLPQGNGYSCAADIARLSLNAAKIPGFTFYCSQQSRQVTVRGMGGGRSFTVKNTNELLGRYGIDSGKTGTTALAGPCLMVTAPKPATVIQRADGSTVVIPHRLIVVTLAAPDRFNATARLLQDGWSAYDQWRNSGSPSGDASLYLNAAPAPLPPAAPAPAPMPPAAAPAPYPAY